MEEEDVQANNGKAEEDKEQKKVYVAMAGADSEGKEITEKMLTALPDWLIDPKPEEHLAFRKIFWLLNEKRDLAAKPKQLYKALKPAEIPGVTLALVTKSLKKARKREKAILDDFLYLMAGGELPDARIWYKFKECRGRRNSMPYGQLKMRKEVLKGKKELELQETAETGESDDKDDDPSYRENLFFTAICYLHSNRNLGDIYEYYRERQKPPEDELWDMYTQLTTKVFSMTNRNLKDVYCLIKRKARKYDPILEPPMFYCPTEKIYPPFSRGIAGRLMRVNMFNSQEEEDEDKELRKKEKEQVAAFCGKNYNPDSESSTCTCSKFLGSAKDDKAVRDALKKIAGIGGALARLPNIHYLFRKPNVKHFRKLNILRVREKIRNCDDAEFDEPNHSRPLFAAIRKDMRRHVKPKGLIKMKIPEIAHQTVLYTLLPYIRREKAISLEPIYEDIKKFKVMSTWEDYKTQKAEKMKTNLTRTVVGDLYDAYGATRVRKADIRASISHVTIKKNKGFKADQFKHDQVGDGGLSATFSGNNACGKK